MSISHLFRSFHQFCRLSFALPRPSMFSSLGASWGVICKSLTCAACALRSGVPEGARGDVREVQETGKAGHARTGLFAWLRGALAQQGDQTQLMNKHSLATLLGAFPCISVATCYLVVFRFPATGLSQIIPCTPPWCTRRYVFVSFKVTGGGVTCRLACCCVYLCLFYATPWRAHHCEKLQLES